MSGSFPNLNEIVSPSDIDWGLEQNSFVFTSFSGITQGAPQVGARWRGTMSFELTKSEKRDLQLFIEDLEGRTGRFCVFDPSEPVYPALGTPNVNQPNQTGKVLTTQGWLPNRLVMRRGQYFNINHELKRCTRDVYSAADGTATLNFNPAIRISPVQSTVINTQAPYMLATLADDYNPFRTNANQQSSISFDFIEAIYERS